MNPAPGAYWGTDERPQVRLHLAGLVLADVQPGADSADTGNPARVDVGGEQLGRGVRVPVQPGVRCGYSGYALPDQPHQQLIGADQRQRRPGRHGRAEYAVRRSREHVGEQRGGDAAVSSQQASGGGVTARRAASSSTIDAL